jgi:glycine cleavage system regulatory protein
VRVSTDHDRQLQAPAVDDLRETLGHYSAAEGLIIHLGDASDGAVQKARIDGEPPITIFDRETFVELLMKHGIGVETYCAPVVTIDADFIDAVVG